jgi:adenylate cyclase
MALLGAVGAAPLEGAPADAAAAPAAGHAEQTVRALREAVERDPATPARLGAALVRAPPPPTGEREGRLLERLARLYGGPATPYLDLYGPPRTILTVPYDRALARLAGTGGGLDVRGKAVFIGLSAHTGAEQRDGVHTVFSEPSGLDLSGVEVAATAFGNLLEGRAVEPAPTGAQLALAIAWGFTLGLLAWRLPTLASAALLLLAGVLHLLIARHRFAATGLWLPLVGPLALQIPVAFAASVLWQHRDTRRERERLSTALAYYLPPRIAEELAREIGDVRAADQLVFGTCLSTDAHQYTTLSETMEPAELSALMNRYYAVLFEPVKRHAGLVQDVVGDSMLAVWATSEPDASLRSRACLAALDIASAVDRFNLESGRLALPTRIGLHSGRMLLGSVGAMDHYEYRAVGDIVNTATRLEGLNKHLGTRLLVSADVLQGLDDLFTRELGAFLLAGKSRPVLVHELVARATDVTPRDREQCAMFAEALAAFRRGAWPEAMRLWREGLRARGGEDGPSRFYLRWCEAHAGEPPGADWDGVVRMDQK